MADGAESRRALPLESRLIDEEFGRFWKEHSGKLRRLCISMLQRNDPADADDAYCRASLKAYQEFPKICDRVENLEAWLVRITYNICIDLFREKRWRNEESFAAYETVGNSPRLLSLDIQEGPEGVLLRKEQRSFLSSSIAELPSRLREAMTTFLQQEDYQESAKALGISPTNFRKRMQEARGLLRHRILAYRSGKGHRVVDKPLVENRSPNLPESTRSIRVVTGGDEQDPTPQLLTLPTAPIKVSKRRLEALESYVRKHPGGWKKKYELGHLLLQTGQHEKAGARFSALVEQRPRHLPSWLGLASAYRLGGNLRGERDTYRKGIAAIYEAAGKAYLRGLLERSHQRWEAAHPWLETATRIDPQSSTAWVALAQNWQDRDRLAGVVMATDRALQADPADVAALLVCHDALNLAGRSREAEERNERALELDPENPIALERWLQYRLSRGELDRSSDVRKHFRLLEGLAVLRAEACCALAFQSLFLGDPAAAEQRIRKWIQRWPRRSQGWVAYTRLHEATGCSEQALQTLEQARALMPPASRGTEILACYLAVRLGERAQVQSRVETLLQHHGSAWIAQATAAWTLTALQLDPAKALALSRSALGLQPELAATWVEHGRTLLRWGQWQEAATTLEEGWRRLPEGDGHALAAVTAMGLVKICQRRGKETSRKEWTRNGADRIEAHRAFHPVEAALLFRHWSHLTKRRPPSGNLPLQGIPPQLWRWTERRLFGSIAGTDLMTIRR